MDHFGGLLRELREKRGLTVNQLAIYSSVSPALISKIENGKRGTPKPETIEKLSKGLKINYEELMALAGHIQTQEQTLPPDATPYEPDNMVKLPILGTVRAGEPILMTDFAEGFELVEPELLRGRQGFVLRVKGNSMTGDRIYEGDLVVVICQQEVEASEIAVVSVDRQEATLKRVKCQGGVCVLTSSNPDFEPYLFPSDTVHILGKVVRVIRDL